MPNMFCREAAHEWGCILSRNPFGKDPTYKDPTCTGHICPRCMRQIGEVKWGLGQVQAQLPPQAIGSASKSGAHNNHEVIETRNGSESAHAFRRGPRPRKANGIGDGGSSVPLETWNGCTIDNGFLSGSNVFVLHSSMGCGYGNDFGHDDIRIEIHCESACFRSFGRYIC